MRAGSVACDIVFSNYSAQFTPVAGILADGFAREFTTTEIYHETFTYEVQIDGVVISSGTISRDFTAENFNVGGRDF